MKMKRYLIGLLVATVLLPACSESLEDTYSDFAGDGKIRYIAKCSDITVTPGWRRLNLTWKNGTDAVVTNIKVSWTANDVKKDTLLNPSDTTCELRNLEDYTYRIDVRGVGIDGSESLVETNYGRPYTEAHEVIRSFTRGVTKYYKVKNKNALVYFTDKWNTNIVDMKLHYTGTDNKPHEQGVWIPNPFWPGEFGYMLAPTFYTVEGVNTEEPIYITRVGKVEACPDTIYFDPIVLSNERNITSDFKMAIQRRYGFTDQTDVQKVDFDHFIDTVRCLEFDYDISSFEDILYCSKLEKIVLGKNRYLDPTKSSAADASILYDATRSVNVLNAANKLLGLKVERYNNHYDFKKTLAYVESKGNPILPDDLEYIPESEIDKITCSVQDIVEHDSHLEALLDNDPATFWYPFEASSVRTYEIVISFKSQQFVRGFKVKQVEDEKVQHYFPNQIRIQVSNDQVIWKSVTHTLEHPLGRGVGEVTLLPMAEPAEVKYVKITLSDQAYVNLFSLRLADIVPYK